MGKFKELARQVTDLLEMGETLDAGELVDLLAVLKPSADAAAKCDTAGCCSFGQRRSAHCACSTDPASIAFSKLAEACGAAGQAQAKLSKPEPVICNNCNGSGDEWFEGSKCRVCGGLGEVAP